MCQLSPIEFHGDTIFCIEHDEQPYAPMRPIVENLGLQWGAQAAKFRANKERWGVVIIAMPSKSTVSIIDTVAKDGKEREMLCLPIRKLPAWFASIHPAKVKPELRAKIELYQNECDDALWNYWMNGRAERKPDTPAEPSPLVKLEVRSDNTSSQKALPGGAKKWIEMPEYAAKIDRLVLETQQKSNEFMKAVSDLGYVMLFRPACLDDEVTEFGKALGHYLHSLGFAAQTTAKSMCEMAEVYRCQLGKRE